MKIKALLVTILLCVFAQAQAPLPSPSGGGGTAGFPCGAATAGYVATATALGVCDWEPVGSASVDQTTIKNAWYITDGGSANTITGTTTTTFPGSYAAGQAVLVKVAATNSGATTININSLGTKAVTKNGATALAAGNLVIGRAYLLVYDGTQFQVLAYTILAADVPTLNQNTSGNAGTATALAANGTNCAAGSPPLGVDASGNAENCTPLTAAQVTNAASTIFAGTKALSTSAISSAACTSAQTVSATGVLTTDVVSVSFSGDPSAVTGFVPLTTGMLAILVYPTADAVNIKVCNNTASSITPGAITLNVRVSR